jgi:hypothetical protein
MYTARPGPASGSRERGYSWQPGFYYIQSLLISREGKAVREKVHFISDELRFCIQREAEQKAIVSVPAVAGFGYPQRAVGAESREIGAT